MSPTAHHLDTNATVVHEFPVALNVREAWRAFLDLPGCLLLESSMRQPDALGRYSFLMADPFDTISVEVGTPEPLAEVQHLLTTFAQDRLESLPPFQGGIAGLFSYDLNQSFEAIPAARHNDFNTPAMIAGCYDVVLAWDHQQNRTWLISQGFPERDSVKRKSRAQTRAKFFLDRLQANSEAPQANPLNGQSRSRQPLTAPQRQIEYCGVGLTSNFSRDEYVDAVNRCIDYIRAGDAFQINLAQQLFVPASSSAAELYEQIRVINPSTFAGYMDAGSLLNRDLKVLSASPERFFYVRDRQVETRPIKGTRPRTGKPIVDLHEQEQLLNSEKDRAENTMIVDLMRNDLSRVCTDDSIVVDHWCQLEAYQRVLHLVSSVRGQLRPDHSAVDLLAAVFPGGSITGAPKVRAMEIIAELEPSSRGFYCGSMGYFGFSGDADLSILIRTITQADGWLQLPVGGGIVVQSDAQNEYEETWTKAAAMLEAIRGTRNKHLP